MKSSENSAGGEIRPTRDAREMTLDLIRARALGKTICPSEVARAMVASESTEVAADAWRNAMPAVHAAVDLLLAEGCIQLSWKGIAQPTRAGPYRIGRNPR